MISLYPHRITVAKADDLPDGWRTLEAIRCRVNRVWARRADMEPCFATRRKPPALEVYRRLPALNCQACGEKSCMAFAVRLWSGLAVPTGCTPVFGGAYGHLKEPLLAICAGLGLVRPDQEET